MKKFGTHICMVSKQADANLLPILDKETRPERVILLVTSEMKDRAASFEAAVRDYVKTEQIPVVSAYDMQALDAQLTALVEKGKVEPEETAVNITGGTKPMSIACFRWCVSYGIPFFYMSLDDAVLTLFSGEKNRDMETHQAKVSGTGNFLPRYLRAHGFELQFADQPKATPARQAFIGFAMKKSWEKEIGWLNKMASDADEAFIARPQSSVSADAIPAAVSSDFFTWADHLDDWIDFSKPGRAIFRGATAEENRENIRFLKGLWFEQAVADAIREAFGVTVYQNVTVRAQDGTGSKNEFDAVFFYKNQLCVVEVKTKKFEEKDNNAQDVLHKLKSITGDVGGIKAKKCLVSYRKLTKSMLARAKAEDNGIFVIQSNDLFPHTNFIGKLKAWLG